MDQTLQTELFHDAEIQLRQFRELLSGIPDGRIDRDPGDGGWTAGQLAEHVINACRSNLLAINGTTAPAGRAYDRKVNLVAGIFLDFDRKLVSPEFIVPRETEHDRPTLVQALDELIADARTACETRDLALLCTSFALPRLGELTGVEWMRFLTWHVQRHNRQLERLAAISS